MLKFLLTAPFPIRVQGRLVGSGTCIRAKGVSVLVGEASTLTPASGVLPGAFRQAYSVRRSGGVRV